MTPFATRLFNDWHAGQGAKIKDARSMAVYGQCLMLAKDRAAAADEHVSKILLTAEQIELCTERALSSARLAKFGAVPRSPEEWNDQRDRVREDWAAEKAKPNDTPAKKEAA